MGELAMRAILTALMLTVATQAGAECGNLCDYDWWKSATEADVQAELDGGADVKARTEDGSVPLYSAVWYGSPATIQVLLDAGADVMARTKFGGYMPLHSAALNGSPANVQTLLDAGADVMARDWDGATPLHWASNSEVIQALLDAGADIMARTENGASPLHSAASRVFPDNIQALLDAGADAKAKNEDGKTPWDLAQENEKLKGTKGYWALNDAQYN